MWQGVIRCRCGSGEPSPGADVAGASLVPVQMAWGERSPGADVAGVGPVPVPMWQRASPVPVQMWQGRAQSRYRCGRYGRLTARDMGRAQHGVSRHGVRVSVRACASAICSSIPPPPESRK
jgi:hypothetical protein